jgi:microcystin-dependent protein
MSQPFVGTIQVFAFGFPPKGWLPCDGQILAISTNQALFSLLGTTYGGDGIRSFALPDLRGRTALGASPSLPRGAASGEETHILIVPEMPTHTHAIMTDSTTAAGENDATPTSNVLGQTVGSPTFEAPIYRTGAAANRVLADQSVGMTGNAIGHENRMPYLVMNFCIALNGIFPSRS